MSYISENNSLAHTIARHGESGDFFATLAECKQSLESDGDDED